MPGDDRPLTEAGKGEGTTTHHALSTGEVLALFGSSAQGLSSAEAAVRLARHGRNALPQPARPSLLRRFAAHFNNVLIYVLFASAAITAALGHFVDTGVILAVLVANAVIGFIQEGRAESAMDSIRKLVAASSSVLRDGKRTVVDAAMIAPGDIVLLEAGDKVPADLRILEANGLSIEEAVLTGESVPVEKSPERADVLAQLGERTSMAYGGTLVTSGTGRGVAVATGSATELGRISGLLSGIEALETPLTRQMDDFGRWLSLLILIFAGLILTYGYYVGHHPFAELFMVVVSLTVAAIPEGLPAVLTITLAVGVQAMARRNAIVRRLPAIETLGSVSVICTDKTGTLTRNEMMVAAISSARADYRVEGEGYAPTGSIVGGTGALDARADGLLQALGLAAHLCNDATISQANGHWVVRGDPMEGALLALAGKLLPDDAPQAWSRIDEIPFDARHRYMAVLAQDDAGNAAIFAKGAPERILRMCALELSASGESVPVDEAHWHRKAEEIAARGQRVLALAMRGAAIDHGNLTVRDLESGLTLLGLVGLIDPPRPEAIAAVAACHRAGIAVKMITGDHAATAAAIGRQVGLLQHTQVLTGTNLDQMDDAALASAVQTVDIFARTSPEHKLRLVTALQSHGLSVAMTGDGVNDAPALKRADAGIAMGQKGSEAAKEASDLVLADDNFASIVAAIREGRTVYDNIRKVISWTLPTNAGEGLTVAAALLLGLALPVTAVQILWINLITGVTLGLALAFEPTEENTMLRPPRTRGEALISGGLLWHVAFVSLLFMAGAFGVYAYAVDKGHPDELARTIALNTLVVFEIFHLFFVRNIYGTSLTWKAARGTRVVWTTVLIITVAQFAITYLPPFQAVLGTSAVPFTEGVIIVALGAVFFVILEIEKQMRLALARTAPRP
ncbi:HAD-IC family P-type ATPase [Aestuariivirga sp.]|uniref:HAD-IC family P-type ATPase n=1 Tax=Aestuariivirga sp. TaxID=2650926 RepID=UPI00391ADFF6